VSFDEIILMDGKQLPLHAAVVPGSGQLISMVDSGSAQSGHPKNGLSAKMAEAKEEWRQVMQQVKHPGKLHRGLRLSKRRSSNRSVLRHLQAVWCALRW
jgi:hypothetical protein